MHINESAAKRAARVLRTELDGGQPVTSHSRALEVVAHQLGFRDWNTAVDRLNRESGPTIGAAVPVLRMFDEGVAREFYVDYLGFRVEWEHRFEPSTPLYTRLTRSGMTIDLSEHHGDGTPGTVLWIPVHDVSALHRELKDNPHGHIRPGVDREAPGGPTLEVIDPFSNVLRFCQPVEDQSGP
jgi:catechol 2,3-dioxygenase-like lactoylglutathione lyase family enzyme